ncbi:MAG TPA: SDR family NAD(P)-dependent oxidoreductase [Pirellulales bacterium]|nr:SDR family NAD(P)-dependent oxidoreductase [Pirellulales bacterium]
MDRQFDDFSIGDGVSFARQFTPDDFAAFSALSGDRNPLHHDADYAARSNFGRPIVPLQLAAAPFSAIAGMFLPGHRSLVLDSQLRAIGPVDYGVEVVYSGQVVSKHPALRALTIRVIAFDGLRVLLEGRLRVRVRDDVPAGAWTDANVPDIENSSRHRVALITGATGAIGGAVCVALARRGWTLILHHRVDEDLAAKWQQTCRREGSDTYLWRCDLASSAMRREALVGLASLPAASLVVHSASPRIVAPLAETMEVNYAALRDLSEALLPGMLRRQRGEIVFLGSSALEHAPPGWDDYVAAKAAATHYVSAFDRRYAPYGVRGTVVAPGRVRGPFSQAAIPLSPPDPHIPFQEALPISPPDPHIPFQDHRPAGADCLLPEEVAETVVDLAERDDHPAGGYVSVSPGVIRHGAWAFRPSPAAPAGTEPVVPATAGNDHTEQGPSPHASVPASPVLSDHAELEALVRRTLHLAETTDLSEAALDVTPGWDSLGHLQLLLSVESAMGVSFSSQELNQTTRYSELCRLVASKLRRQ